MKKRVCSALLSLSLLLCLAPSAWAAEEQDKRTVPVSAVSASGYDISAFGVPLSAIYGDA